VPPGGPRILEGIAVLDFSQVLAGPGLTRAMAEMGAEVIKIEGPGGEISRHLPHIRDGQSGYFLQQNRGKQSVSVDLKTEAGRKLVQNLAARVDVLVESFTPGVIGRLGLGYDVLRETNPRLVMCSISAFGQEGPLATTPGYDNIAQAYSGVTSMAGEPDGAPSYVGVAIGDVLTGANALAGVLAALLHRERTGEGQLIDVALIDSYFSAHEMNVQTYSGSGGTIEPTRSGRHHRSLFPYGVFKAKDEYVFIAAAGEHQWPYVCQAVGRPELAADPRLADHAGRIENFDEVLAVIEDWLDGFDSAAEGVAALSAARVPVAPVLSVAEAIAHPHMRQRGTVRTVHDRLWGDVDLPGPSLHFSAFPDDLELEAPFLGEHNEDVLTRHLGLTAEDVRALERDGVLFEDAQLKGRVHG
jgi:crotonobetainyl-CoA:carnitine CoA-transferase CaiB-like acyl-CoA transferase